MTPRISRTFKAWPIGLALALVAFVVFEMCLLAIAQRSYQGPDDENYYEDGLLYHRVQEQEARQKALGWSVTLHVDGTANATGGRSVSLALLDSNDRPVPGAQVDVDAGRPATRLQDHHASLVEGPAGTYSGSLPLQPGTWDIKVTTHRRHVFLHAERRTVR